MSDITADFQRLAEPRSVEENIKDAIQRAADATNKCMADAAKKLKYWRAFDIWYGKARHVRDFEKEAIVKALIEKKRLETRNEVQDLRRRLEILESRIARVDEDFHRENSAALRQQVRGLG